MFNFHRLLLIYVFNLMLTTPISSSEKNPHLEILALKCEYLTKPINIDVKKPRFSWILGSAERGQSQTAYQIFVSSDENKFGDMWNSGRINSSETSQIMYEGKDLKSNSKYFWKVISWDNCGIKIESEKTYFWTDFPSWGLYWRQQS